MEKRKVVTIPATVNRFTASPMSAPKKRKVAAYARVSTDSDEQFTSYAAQIDYYTQFIKARDDWEFISVYTEEERSYPALFYSQIENHFILMNDLYSDTIIK